MATAPPLEPHTFQKLAGTDQDEAERRFSKTVSEFHRYLNTSSAVANIQSRRAKWASPRSEEAFQNRKFEPQHWYTFNAGGRTEAQLNLGMFPTRLRIGLGFEFTEREHGDPKHVREAFARFYNAVRDHRLQFETAVQSLPIELELYPWRGGHLQVISSGHAVDTLLDLPREPDWIFVGRMLRPGMDDAILSDGELLGAELDRVFSTILPWWELSNQP